MQEPPATTPTNDKPRELLAARRARRVRIAKTTLRIGLPALVLFIVWREVRSIDAGEAIDRMRDADAGLLLLAALAAALSLLVMGCYDLLAFRHADSLKPVHRWRLGVLLFSWTNFLTLGPIGGPALRLYFYRRAGLDNAGVVRGLAGLYTGMLSGVGAWVVAGLTPLPDAWWSLPVRIAIALALSPLFAVALARFGSRVGPKRFKRFTVDPDLPAIRLGLVGVTDWGFFFVCFTLCAHAVGLPLSGTEGLRAVVLGHIAGVVSMIPGGLGSADAVWLKMMTLAGGEPETAAAQIFLFRMIFYAIPWLFALLAMYILFAGRTPGAQMWQRRVLAGAVVFNAGVALASAATPSLSQRLLTLERRVSLEAVEASHAAAVLIGVTTLFLIRGVLRGYRLAFFMTCFSLAAVIAAHMLKGWDWEEALVAAFVLLLLLGARDAFRRRGRIPIGWEVTLASAAGAGAFFLVIGVSAFRDTPYSHDLWRAFAHEAEASRVLRGGAIVAFVGLAFIVRQALIPTKVARYAAPGEIDRSIAFIRANAPRTLCLSVGAGDKDVWWWGERGLVVHQRVGDTMVVLGDPTLRDDADSEGFLDALQEHAISEDLDLVFYQVSEQWRERLREFGFSFFKLGEEALAPIDGFSLDHPDREHLRKIVDRASRQGADFRVLDPPHPPALLAQLRAVSDDWLRSHHAKEMQFSVGYFSAPHLNRFPLGCVMHTSGAPIAFLNLLLAKPGHEASFDVLRYREGAVDNVVEFTLAEAMRWSAQRGAGVYSLGMTPVLDAPHAPPRLSERLAGLVHRRTERVYRFRGLQSFEEKLGVRWAARYLAHQQPWDWASSSLAATRLVQGKTREARKRIAEAHDER